MPYAALENDSYHQPTSIQRKPPQAESFARATRTPQGTEPTPAAAPDPVTKGKAAVQEIGIERLLNAREVAARLGVSERWVRDHTTRRSPKIRGVKLGPLMRYRIADVDEFMRGLLTSKAPHAHRF